MCKSLLGENKTTGALKVNGLYLYCIREKAQQKITTEGIDGKSKVFLFPYQDLEAVVSEVPLEEFDSEEIQQKAQEDLNWIKEKSQLHEAVVEEAMGSNGNTSAVIPMTFGTIFKSREKIQRTVAEHYSEFENLLTFLQGKQEWGVKVYLSNRKALEEIIKNNDNVKATQEKISVMPKGMAYFFEKQMAEQISSEISREIEIYTQEIFLALTKHAQTGIKGKILDKELTGKCEPMVLNAIYLIQTRDVEHFKKEINRLSREMDQKGFQFEYSGPWPPYNFTKLEEYDSIC